MWEKKPFFTEWMKKLLCIFHIKTVFSFIQWKQILITDINIWLIIHGLKILLQNTLSSPCVVYTYAILPSSPVSKFPWFLFPFFKKIPDLQLYYWKSLMGTFIVLIPSDLHESLMLQKVWQHKMEMCFVYSYLSHQYILHLDCNQFYAM